MKKIMSIQKELNLNFSYVKRLLIKLFILCYNQKIILYQNDKNSIYPLHIGK